MSSNLAELGRVLEQINTLIGEGKERYDADERQRWCIEHLWIYAGNLAIAHCDAESIQRGAEPWTELIGVRNAYAHFTPHELNAERIWAETAEAASRLSQAVVAAEG